MRFPWPWRRGASQPAPAAAPVKRARMKIPAALLPKADPLGDVRAFVLPTPPPGVVPAKALMAQDEAITGNYSWANGQAMLQGPAFAAVGRFLGYGYLSELAQLPEYRRMAEIIAKSMTRNWIKLTATGSDTADESKAERLRAIEAEMKRLGVQDVFRQAAEQDGFFGLSHVYIDTGATDKPELLALPLVAKPETIKKGDLKALRLVEPIWTYPNAYDTTDPLKPDYYRPKNWYVMGKLVSSTRLLTFIGRKVPDLLKPSYNFGGLSLTQMAMPYVNNWIRTRTSVGELIHNFSTMVLETDLQSTLEDGIGGGLIERAQLFNQTRDNRGLMMVNFGTEKVANVSVPLASLDKLQAQAQEQTASVNGIPLVVQFGITPSGLNASSDGEIRAFYDWIRAYQEQLFTEPLTTVLNIIQLSLFGKIDEEIGFTYEPLWQLDDVAKATERKTNADTAAVYIASGVLAPAEERERLATEEDSLYPSLDVNDVPDPPDEPEPGTEGDPAAGMGGRSEEREV